RRHTRSKRDWSSDVCSSDLGERKASSPNDHWPWAMKLFAPRHDKYPTFRLAQVLLPDGRTMDLQVSLLSITQEVEVRAESRKRRSEERRVGKGGRKCGGGGV